MKSNEQITDKYLQLVPMIYKAFATAGMYSNRFE